MRKVKIPLEPWIPELEVVKEQPRGEEEKTTVEKEDGNGNAAIFVTALSIH